MWFYTLTYLPKGADFQPSQEPGKPARFEAHLVRLGDDLFLDLYPGELTLTVRVERRRFRGNVWLGMAGPWLIDFANDEFWS